MAAEGGNNPMGAMPGAVLDPGSLILSPRTRRRHRGRGTVVLDDLTTASAITNPTVLTPEFISAVNPMISDAVISSLNQHSQPMGTGPSPDEMMIKSRGPRRVPLTFSPDVHATSPRRQNMRLSSLVQSGSNSTSLGRGMTRLLLPTRTSPRKRLTLNDSPPQRKMAGDGSFSPSALAAPSPEKLNCSPISKKPHQSSPKSTSASPKVLMKGLCQPQLVELVESLMQKHPEMETEILDLLPTPDLKVIEDKLVYLKRNIFKALPNTRLESKTDSMAYNRVATHLLALKKTVLEEGKNLLDSNQFPSVVNYTLMAWSYVKATPVWDNPPHNNVRKHCFKFLASNCLQALKKHDWSSEEMQSMRNKLQPLEKDSDEIAPCIKHLDQILNNSES